MNPFRQSKATVQTTFAAVIITALMIGLTPAVYSDETKSDAQPPKTDSSSSQTNYVNPKVDSTNSVKVAVKYQLTGAELYSINCNRCHQERYPTERTGAHVLDARLAPSMIAFPSSRLRRTNRG